MSKRIKNNTDETIEIEPGEVVKVRASEDQKRIMSSRARIWTIEGIVWEGSYQPTDTDGSFDYGERLEDGQFERHPTIDEGEFIQPIRRNYVHDECGGTTGMTDMLAESFARAPNQYSKTFCSTCGGYHPLEEFTWEGTDIQLNESGQ